jgi:hypothetical protein
MKKSAIRIDNVHARVRGMPPDRARGLASQIREQLLAHLRGGARPASTARLESLDAGSFGAVTPSRIARRIATEIERSLEDSR